MGYICRGPSEERLAWSRSTCIFMRNTRSSALNPCEPLFQPVTGISFNRSVLVKLQDGVDSFGSVQFRFDERERQIVVFSSLSVHIFVWAVTRTEVQKQFLKGHLK